MYFNDSSCPSREILYKFLEIAKKEGPIAVHCKARIDRMGTLYLLTIKNYHFNAADFIGWMLLCQPASFFSAIVQARTEAVRGVIACLETYERKVHLVNKI